MIEEVKYPYEGEIGEFCNYVCLFCLVIPMYLLLFVRRVR